ncbi:MAG: 2-C-methyl-D-erythritol 2,4-cyclodiphosphate synthase [Piscirickettsiaceae bacterium]|nr:MAG: 2-C-methyl-D-erythritol 2,4-cyclodiphosphate synthase [Piscirickettsiaceae bacterium]
MRIGHGYDAHRFIADKRLVLGGVTIPYKFGLLAHSDGDVVIHALCDALLGAAGLGDIGQHFPDTDNNYENIDSRILLRWVVALLKTKNLLLINADITIIAQAPKLAGFLSQMADNMALDMNTSSDLVNLKATTTEGMGFAGRKEGIEVHTVVLLSTA